MARAPRVCQLPVTDTQGEQHHYLVSAAPLRPPQSEAADQPADITGAVVVCHDVTEVHRLDEERRGRAAAEERRRALADGH